MSEVKNLSLDEIRSLFANEVNVQYNNLINSINRIPMLPLLRQHAFQNLDQGIEWVRKGVQVLELPKAPETVVTETSNKPEFSEVNDNDPLTVPKLEAKPSE